VDRGRVIGVFSIQDALTYLGRGGGQPYRPHVRRVRRAAAVVKRRARAARS
jgi:hypothetical protein